MSDLIEAMARRIVETMAQRPATEGEWAAMLEDGAPIDWATAALAALRETHHLVPKDQEPVGWQYERNARSPHLNCETRTSGYQWPDWMQDGWTEQALYALEKRHD